VKLLLELSEKEAWAVATCLDFTLDLQATAKGDAIKPLKKSTAFAARAVLGDLQDKARAIGWNV
jgi:hypothetical protein